MELQKNNPTLKLTLDSSTIFSILLALIWSRHTVVTYVLIVISRLPLIGVLYDVIYPATIVLLVVILLPWMVKKINAEATIFYLAAVMAVLASIVLFPVNSQVVSEKAGQMITAVLPMIFVGMCYDHRRHKKMLFWISLIGTITTFAYQLYQLSEGRELKEDSMSEVYVALPSIMYLLYYALDKKKLKYWLIAVFGIITAFVYGTRGPILCLLIFLIVGILYTIRNTKSTTGRIIIFAIIAMALYLIFSKDALFNLAEYLSERFEDWGFSTRIFDYFIEGEIAEDSGRGNILTRAMAAINEKPLIGYGVLGDQVKLDTYPHNIFVELWMQFGIVIGTAIALYMVFRPLRALWAQRGNSELTLFIWMLICMNFVKLVLSSTYTAEKMLFFMIGVAIAASRKSARLDSNNVITDEN